MPCNRVIDCEHEVQHGILGGEEKRILVLIPRKAPRQSGKL